jgi:hypothetical protein
MTLTSKEHYELMEGFEKFCKPGRTDKEPKEGWARGIVYQDGTVNELFKVYRMGYAHGKAVEQREAA